MLVNSVYDICIGDAVSLEVPPAHATCSTARRTIHMLGVVPSVSRVAFVYDLTFMADAFVSFMHAMRANR